MQNQTFNIKRFVAYTKYMVMVNWKKRVLTAGALIIAFIAIIALNRNTPLEAVKNGIAILFMIISGIMVIASAFPGLKTKESMIQYLTIPASNIEKFFAEVVTRFGLLISLPFLIETIGNATIKSNARLEAIRQGLESPKTYWLFNFSGTELFGGEYIFTTLTSITMATVIIAGICVFKKHPFLKTILFVGVINTIVSTYFYLMTHNFLFRRSRMTRSSLFNAISFKAEPAETLAIIAASVICLWTLTYAFFKLKEKEI